MSTNSYLRPGRLLGKKMALTNVVTAAAALLVASIALIVAQFLALRSEMAEDMRVQARIVGTNSSAALMFNDARGGEEILAAMAMSPHVLCAGIFDTDRKMLARYRRSEGVRSPVRPEEIIAAGYRVDYDYMYVAEPIAINNQQIGFVLIRAGMEQLYSRLATYAGLTLAVALGSLLLAYALVSSMRRAVRKAETHLHYLAHVDPVTALPNRHEFNARLAFALERAQRRNTSVGLLLLDLDNFKVVNDTLGHDCGDVLLKLVAQRLATTLRTTDVICRIGGDEFVVIVERDDERTDMDGVARKILAALAEPLEVQGHQLYVSTSIGVSVYPRDAGDGRTLTRNADTAMYHAKNNGKNGFGVFEPEMEQRAQKRMQIEANLRRALDRDELQLYYQPQVDLRSGDIVGVEALLRWNCPQLGSVSPADFIPIAEESGIIVPLGRWVLQTACRQGAAWRAAGLLDTIEHVAVNLSARQTKDAGLMGDINAILADTGLPAHMLELEITEGVLMENVNANLDLLHGFQAAGIRLSIDDFGTGYSSMSYLKRFPIDQLKIDRSFVGDVPGDGEAIATAIIAMARSLGLAVVAEGVETAAQVAFLRNAGCDVMQGYHFARPMPAQELTAMLQARREVAVEV
ncbi:MAG: putative bifunctional diguanylate cyclase/phosphodiesterase [Telluria sp.]